MSKKFDPLPDEAFSIGNNVEIKPMTIIAFTGFGFEKDPKTNKFKIPYVRKKHRFRTIIEDDVSIGACCVIDRGHWRDSIIGKGTKIDNLVHTGHNTQIGKYCLIVAGTVIGGSCTIGDHCSIGMNVSINPHLTIAHHVTIGAGSVVTKDITEPNTTWAGNPARKFRDEQVVL